MLFYKSVNSARLIKTVPLEYLEKESCTVRYYDRKILDFQRRYDDQYDKITEAELQTEDIRKRIQTIRSEQISGENVYQLLLAFR